MGGDDENGWTKITGMGPNDALCIVWVSFLFIKHILYGFK